MSPLAEVLSDPRVPDASLSGRARHPGGMKLRL